MMDSRGDAPVLLTGTSLAQIRSCKTEWRRWKCIFSDSCLKRVQIDFSDVDDVSSGAWGGPNVCRDVVGLLTELLLERFRRRMRPITLVVCEKSKPDAGELGRMIEARAISWMEYGYCGSSFVDWMKREVTCED